MDITALANELAKGGSVAIIIVLLVVITAFIRRWVIIPDANFVPREMYEAKVKEAEDWKGIVKDYGDAFHDAVTVLEAVGREK